MKRCTKCGAEKPFSEFYREKRRLDGLRSDCKECTDARNRMWSAANPKKSREINAKNLRRLRAQHSEHYNEQQRAYLRYCRERISDGYVAKTLGISVKDLAPEFIDLQRESLGLKRTFRELKQTLENLNDDTV